MMYLRLFVWSAIAALCLAGCRVELSSTSPEVASETSSPMSGVARGYAPTVDRIVRSALSGNDSWEKMEALCDGIGHRLSGSAALDKAIEWAAAAMKADGHENVHLEKVMVPKWVRGKESASVVEPRPWDLPMLGLGGSVGTSPEGITAEVEVVRDEAELEALGDAAAGKIVLFNNPMPPYDPKTGTGYGRTVRFRVHGARLASYQGAVGVLVRSVTANSLRSPHTGGMSYGDAKQRIPAAAITLEDAETIARLRARGVTVRINLKMSAKHHGDVPSANVVAELRGRTTPEEVVVIGGHIDSWDVGQGAHDDATGVVAAMEAISVLRKLGLRPRRTIRVVLWTNEENGLRGGKQYAIDHKDEMSGHVAAIESDGGCFGFRGFGIDMKDNADEPAAGAQLAALTRLLEPIGAEGISLGWGGADISPMRPYGVPLLALKVDMSTYFNIHHTHADTLEKVEPKELSKCVAAMASMAYMLADMPGRLGPEKR